MMQHTCPLCGNKFHEGGTSSCADCPLHKKCDFIKCPNCRYEFIPGVDER